MPALDQKWFERNEQAEELEIGGDIAGALALYEQNIADGCDTSFSYERAASIYRNQGRYADEVTVLKTAVQLERRHGISRKVALLESRLETAIKNERKPPEERRPEPVIRRSTGNVTLQSHSGTGGESAGGCTSVILILVLLGSLIVGCF